MSMTESYLMRLTQEEREDLLQIMRSGNSEGNEMGVPGYVMALAESHAKNKPLTEDELEAEVKWVQSEDTIADLKQGRSIIKELKSTLRHETQVNKELRDQLSQISFEYEREKVGFMEQNKKLKEKISSFGAHIEKLINENTTIKRKVKAIEKRKEEAEAKTQSVQAYTNNLRILVQNMAKDLQLLKNSNNKDHKIWKALEVEEFLSISEPPQEFPVPEAAADKNSFYIRGEIERLNLELRKYEGSMKKITAKCDKLEQENQDLIKLRNDMQKDTSNSVTQLKKQLIGAVRRINYLIEEKKRMQEENQKRAEYTAKLELKLVQENLNVKGLRQKVKTLSEKIDDKKIEQQKIHETQRLDDLLIKEKQRSSIGYSEKHQKKIAYNSSVQKSPYDTGTTAMEEIGAFSEYEKKDIDAPEDILIIDETNKKEDYTFKNDDYFEEADIGDIEKNLMK